MRYTCGGNINVQKEGDKVCDIRGFKTGVDGPTVPSHYCTYCRCPPTKCHNRLFGKFIQIQIISESMESDAPKLTPNQIEAEFRFKYRSAIKQKIFEDTKTLDTYPYDVPICIEQLSLGKIYDYQKVNSYHNDIIKLIFKGRGNPLRRKRSRRAFGGQAFIV